MTTFLRTTCTTETYASREMTPEEISRVEALTANFSNATITGVHINDNGFTEVWLAQNFMSTARHYPNNHREYQVHSA